MGESGMLILAQADHLTGEEIGYAIDQIMDWGADNVYAFPGISKKSRSGCVLLIDVDPQKDVDWRRLLAEHLSIYGYHHLQTAHYYSRTQTQSRTVVIRKASARLESEVCFKFAEGIESTGRVEHADLIALRRHIQHELNHNVSIPVLRSQLQARFSQGSEGPITVDL